MAQNAQIQIRRDTAANWTATNPTLTNGEMGYETDTGFLKVGDGATAWTALAYFSTGAGVVPTTQAGTAYTAVLADAPRSQNYQGYILFTAATAVAFTIPANATAAFPIGTVITAEQNGAGVITLTPAVGVTLNSRGGLLATAGQYAVAQVKKVATDIWTVIGDVA